MSILPLRWLKRKTIKKEHHRISDGRGSASFTKTKEDFENVLQARFNGEWIDIPVVTMTVDLTKGNDTEISPTPTPLPIKEDALT